MVSDWKGSISGTTRSITTKNELIQRYNHCMSNREKRSEKAFQTFELHGKTRRKASCRLSKKKRDRSRSRSVEQLRSSSFLEWEGFFFLVATMVVFLESIGFFFLVTNTTWENLQIEKHKSGRRSFRSPNWFVLFDLQVFSGGVYSPSATSRTISFSISNSFCY